MFRICTGQPDAEPEPALRSLTSISTLSEEPNLPDSAELFRINASDFGSPCDRDRLFFLVLDRDRFSWSPEARAHIDALLRNMYTGPSKLNDFLMASDDAEMFWGWSWK